VTTGLAEVLLGLPGFRVLEVTEAPAEVVVTIETTANVVGCATCGTRAESRDRVRVSIRDLACFGRPARLVWTKRRWRCRESLCPAKTWSERCEHLDARVVLTRQPARRRAARSASSPAPSPRWPRSSGCAGGR
jgi:transposase